MTKFKRVFIFVIVPLLFLSIFLFILIHPTGLSISNTRRTGRTVNPEGRLTVDTEFGTIHIQTADPHYVDIFTRKEWKSAWGIFQPKPSEWIEEMLKDFEVTIEQDNSHIRIEGKFNHGRGQWQDGLKWLKVEFLVTVPSQYNVSLKTASRGDIHVGNIDGAVRAEASDGNLHFGEIQGEVWGKTGMSGSITLKGCQSNVGLTAAMGDIRAEMTTQPQHPWTLHTSGSGDIRVTLHPDIAVNVDAQTRRRISSDFPVQGAMGENRLKGTLNGGGPLLKLRTSSGAIRLKRLKGK